MRYSDEQLMAYADGELPAAEAGVLREAARQDAELARRIERFAATRRVLANSLRLKLDEPVPQRLLDAINAPASAATPPSRVIPLRRRPSPWRSVLPLALAASFVLGVGLLSSRLLLEAPDPLSAALEHQASGVPFPTARGDIVALSTLKTGAGDYCREYERGESGARTRGLACRGEGGLWTERSLPAPETEAGGGYQLAAGEAGDAAAALGAERLGPEDEKKLIEKRWR